MNGLERRLGLWDASAIVVGTVIGSAIFLVPAEVARALPNPIWIYAVWTVTGLLSLFGALAYAELGAMLPDTGGQYVYLREAFGPLTAFLCGWSFFLIIQSGGIATLAVGFSVYLGYFVPLGLWGGRLVAAGLIAGLTWVSYRGVVQGAFVQNVLTVSKLAGIAILVTSAFLSPAVTQPQLHAAFTWTAFGVAMIPCLWAYEGWNCLSFVGGEVNRPRRNIPLSLGLGVTGLVAIYLIANAAYLRILPAPELARTERVAAVTAERTFAGSGGAIGAGMVTVTILISILGSLNGSIMTAPRIYQAQAVDKLFFAPVARVHPRFRTPHVSLVLHSGWSALLALWGGYAELFSYVIFAGWIFYALTVIGVIVLRYKMPGAPRPYRMTGYPWTPLLFAAISLWFVWNTLWTSPGPSIIGLAVIAAGVPVYYAWRRFP